MLNKRMCHCVEFGKPEQNPEGGSLLPTDNMAHNMLILSLKIQRVFNFKF